MDTRPLGSLERGVGTTADTAGRTACATVLLITLFTSLAVAAPARKKAPPKPVPGDLASLARAFRDDPTLARRTALEKYAAAHARDRNGPLARLALGIAAYEQKDFAAAIAALSAVRIPQISDYTAYYLGAARVESNDNAGVPQALAATHDGEVPSPLGGRAYLLQARALKGTPEAVRLLRDHYAALPQPDGDLTLADCYQAVNDLSHAADFYQRVYYEYVSGDAPSRAAAALVALRDAMGATYPQPLPQQLLRRADRFLEVRDYAHARAEYASAVEKLADPVREQARVRMGAADFLAGNAGAAYAYLRGLDTASPDAAAEKLYYLEECARRLSDDGGMMAAVRSLGELYPKSPWRLKALLSAGNRFLLVNRTEDYIPLYEAAYRDFPSEQSAGTAHWKVTFHAWLGNQPGAADLLREQLQRYPTHPTAGAALYFLGRSAEQGGDPGAGRACYEKLTRTFQNTYYAMQARARLARPEVASAPVSEQAVAFLSSVAFQPANPVPDQDSRTTTLRIERSRLLRAAGLDDLADSELRFGARTDGQPARLAMELASSADAPYRGVRIMKSMVPDYLGLSLDAAPRRFWELLFPLPYRSELFQSARGRGVDPYLVAGLIRQESEFNPRALSHANAYGLTQVRPATGRRFARAAGVGRFSTGSLYQPAVNLKIGSAILRSMLDEHGGKLEPTLAGYNAGPNRVVEWLAWNTYREPAEFVESIPFTETRDYVQAVLRNADVYRRLYGR